MRVVIQRVNHARVIIEGKEFSRIDQGLCVFLGVEREANTEDMAWLVNKIVNLRIFGDEEGKMNQSVLDIGGEILLISQFTLHASTRKGNRPSFIQSERPDLAQELYEKCIILLDEKMDKPIQTGQFGGDMKIDLVNDGPVTILIDTEYKW